MNFTEWSTELIKLQERMKETALQDVEESLSVRGQYVGVILGRGRDPLWNGSSTAEPIVYLDGFGNQVSHLRPLYTKHKAEFDAMLESLTESVDTVMEATDKLMESMTLDQIPDAMIERMKGAQTSGEPKELVLASCRRKLETLEQTLLDRIAFLPAHEAVLKSFEIEFPSVAERILSMELAYGNIAIQRGSVELLSDDQVKVPDPEQGMYFLANYDFIEAKLLKACDAMISVRNQ